MWVIMKKSDRHVAIWIDHRRARIVHVLPHRADEPVFEAAGQEVHNKHVGLAENEHERRAGKQFFRRVERSIKGAEKILLLGPSTAKLEFARYLRKHAHAVERKIVGIETMAQATNVQLNVFTKEYFPSKGRRLQLSAS
jgi:stalled ribosome rescue protein Dom34